MEEMLIGPYIRQRRLDKGWTLEYLCDGICTAPTLSRIETNTRTPSSSVLKALLERLGLPAGQFFALLSENDIAMDRLQKKIRDDKIRFRRAAEPDQSAIREQILHNLKTLEELGGEDNRFVRQFVLSTKAVVGRPERPYSPDEQLEMLMEAIHLTIPRFDLKKIPSFRYSVEEVMLIGGEGPENLCGSGRISVSAGTPRNYGGVLVLHRKSRKKYGIIPPGVYPLQII